MKKILITGSNGLLGQKIVHQLHQDKNIDFLATSKGENRIESIKDFKFESMDICDLENVKSLVEKYQPTTIINTAAMTNVDACEKEKELCWKLNVEAVSNLIEACKINNTHLIHLSTDFIFDGKAGPYDEKAQPNPLSYYGKSKLEGERLIQESNLDWAILRTVLVYGICENMSRSNIVLWAKSAFEKGDPIKVINDQARTPTLAEDLAQGCILAAQKAAKGIFNISGKDFMHIDELVKRVGKFFELDTSKMSIISSETLNQAAKRPPITGFILDKAIKELGYNPHGFEEGLAVVAKQLQN